MSACEKCWAKASFRARLNGTSVADEYPIVLTENDGNPDHIESSSTPEGSES